MKAGILTVTKTQSHEFKNLINPPEFPLPWRPSERAAIKRRLFLDNFDTATKFGYIMVESSHYLTPVKRHRNDMSLVHADRVTQLSNQGEAMLDIALSIADHSSR